MMPLVLQGRINVCAGDAKHNYCIPFDSAKRNQLTESHVKAKLCAANRYVSSNIPAKSTDKMRKKSETTGCYLFLHSPEELQSLNLI